jgi:saccharopine dehydrogenase (NAD+, L-lysine forming)
MIRIGLVKEGKTPPDNRVAFTPAQCQWIRKNIPGVEVLVQSSPNRCFSDKEYLAAGIQVTDDITDCDILLGIKEIPVADLISNKTYLFFSHTRKKQPYNQELFRAMIRKEITLIDYECLEHADGQRILGFGFFAGVVGAHNGIMAYGKRSGAFELERVYKQQSFRELIHTYFGLKLPNIKIVVTGSGRVAHGILEVMNLMEVIEVEPDEYLSKQFTYPVFTQLKGGDLYEHKSTGGYNREDFHANASNYNCKFLKYAKVSQVLMNGIYWERSMPRLFEMADIIDPSFIMETIADITDDKEGSVPCNLGDSTIENPVYGVDRITGKMTTPYIPGSIDIMAVGNLPNELSRDSSRYFGEQMIKHILHDLLGNSSAVIDRATILKHGKITERFNYMEDYANLEIQIPEISSKS